MWPSDEKTDNEDVPSDLPVDWASVVFMVALEDCLAIHVKCLRRMQFPSTKLSEYPAKCDVSVSVL
jgi:hypothetical protein